MPTALRLAAAAAVLAVLCAAPSAARTVADVVTTHGDDVAARFRAPLERAGHAWPPRQLRVLAFKHERRLEVWAGDEGRAPVLLATYPFTAMSGRLGPKARQGDLQIPEGVYGLPVLNPNSSYHLSIRVDYPNADDVARSEIPRRQMGGDIYVHGEAVTIGCIPIGNPAIEELFTLAALVPAHRRGIVISPVDFRTGVPDDVTLPEHPELYAKIERALATFDR
jgi:hypothetical protein